MITSTRRSLVVVALLMVSAAVPVRAAPRLPAPIRDALNRMGVAPDAAQAMIDATLGIRSWAKPECTRATVRVGSSHSSEIAVSRPAAWHAA